MIYDVGRMLGASGDVSNSFLMATDYVADSIYLAALTGVLFGLGMIRRVITPIVFASGMLVFYLLDAFFPYGSLGTITVLGELHRGRSSGPLQTFRASNRWFHKSSQHFRTAWILQAGCLLAECWRAEHTDLFSGYGGDRSQIAGTKNAEANLRVGWDLGNNITERG